jgi:hypothetical protein
MRIARIKKLSIKGAKIWPYTLPVAADDGAKGIGNEIHGHHRTHRRRYGKQATAVVIVMVRLAATQVLLPGMMKTGKQE